MIWYRDLLLIKSTQDTSHIIFSEDLLDLKRLAKKLSYERIQYIIEELDHAKSRWKYNVNQQLTLEILFMEMQRNDK